MQDKWIYDIYAHFKEIIERKSYDRKTNNTRQVRKINEEKEQKKEEIILEKNIR